WVRSYWRHDILRAQTASRWYTASANCGQLRFLTWTKATHNPSDMRSGLETVASEPRLVIRKNAVDVSFWLMGIGAGVQVVPGTEFLTLVLPPWLPVVLLLILPLFCALRWWRQRRPTADLCPTCGYDLRATPAKSG